MSINLNEPAVELRESRLRTITGYKGDAAHPVSRNDFSNRERSFTQCGSCSADDVPGICDALADELGIPVVATLCERFRTNIWATGFDASNHSILRKIVKPARQKQPDLINVISFKHQFIFESVFKQLGLRPNHIVPLSTIEQLEHISEAAATVQYCESLGSYLAAGLEQHFGVPEVKAPAPFGINASNEMLREIGRLFHKETEVEKVIASEKEKICKYFERLRGKNWQKSFYCRRRSVSLQHHCPC